MAELRAALGDVNSGRGRLVMLAGEPGIGKTRLAQELAGEATSQGFRVLWGWCYEEAGAPPYWPWVQPLRAYIQQAVPEQLRADLGSGASAIAGIIPHLQDRLSDLEVPPQLEPEQARFRLFDSINTFLRNAARRQPLVLVLEDLHWADRSSLLLLEFIAQQLQTAPVMLIGTYRDVEVTRQHPLSQSLGSLIKSAGFERLQLSGLSQSEVAQLLENTPAWDSSPRTVAAILQRTEGNPLFVGELLRGLNLVDSPELPLGGVPEGVKDAIGRRLSRLSDRCNHLLTTASIIGREFDLRLLEALVDDPGEDRLLAAMEEALSAGIIEEVPDSPTAYQFTHALMQDVLAAGLSAARRLRLHARIAECLERLYDAEVEAHAAELALHYAQAVTLTGAEKLVRYSRLAGERALAGFAWEEALQHFQKGLAAKGVPLTGPDPARDAEEAGLLYGLGRAHEGVQERLWSGPEIFDCFQRAFEYYVAANDTQQAVNIAAHHVSSNLGDKLIAKALELVPPDSHDAGKLLSRHIMPLRADFVRAQEAFASALTIAQRHQDLDLEMQTLVAGACVSFVQCRFQESLDLNRRAIELAGRVDQPASEAHARYDLTHSLYAIGDLEGATYHAAAMLNPAERSGIRAWRSSAMEANDNVSSAKGDWKAAREFSEQGLMIEPKNTILLGARALLEYQTGDFDSAEVFLDRLLEILQQGELEFSRTVTMATPWYVAPAVVIPVIAHITGVPARFEIAEVIAHRVMSSPYVQLGPRRAAQVGLALMAVQRGDSAASSGLYPTLLALRGTMFPQCPWGHAQSSDRILGLLAQNMGNLEQAEIHFEESLAFCRRAGFRPELAWSCHDFAVCLLQRRGEGDFERAAALLTRGLGLSQELGMEPLSKMITALREIMLGASTPATKNPSDLTDRQVEVLRLLAQGRTNREIALELVLSERTIQRHIADIYDKTGVRNRAEATAFAMSQLQPDQ